MLHLVLSFLAKLGAAFGAAFLFVLLFFVVVLKIGVTATVLALLALCVPALAFAIIRSGGARRA